MPNDPESYVHSLAACYLRLPNTTCRLSRCDRRLARNLFERQVPLALVEAAFLLASARRAARPCAAPPLDPIRSLHYFLPVIEEILQNPLPDSYLAYLRRKLALTPPA